MFAAEVVTDFRSDPRAFRRQTARRLLVEMLLFVALLLAAILLTLPPAIPSWFLWAAVIACGAYILTGLALYPRSKAIASSFCVKVHNEGLIFSHAHGGGEVRYSDLRLAKVKRKGDELVEIVLVARSGQVVRLRCLDNMTELHRSLSARLVSSQR